MVGSNYNRSREVEYMARDLLRSNGYNVIRSAESRSPVDLIAWREHDYPIFLQIKRARIRVRDPGKVAQTYRDDLDAFRKITCPHKASRHLWIWEDRHGWRFFLVQQGGICEVSDVV